jgi:thiamine biosynthesis protein ThiS
MALTLVINGKERSFDDLPINPTILDIVAALALKQDRVAFEHNGEIVSRSRWKDVAIAENDRIEMVHFVGGGQ